MKKRSSLHFNQHNTRLLPILVIAIFALLGSGFASHIKGFTDSTSPSASAASDCIIDEKLVNSCRPWIGVAAGGYSMAGSNTATVQTEFYEKRLNDPDVLNNPSKQVTIDKKADFIHVYRGRGDTLNSYDLSYINRPNTYLQMNWKPVDGSWASGGGGDAGVNADIDKTANSIKAVAPKKIMLSIFHEPENDITSNPVSGCNVSGGTKGTPAEYVQMWRNTRARFDALGVTNVVWNINYMGYVDYNCVVSQLWPGNAYVDWVTYDPYVEGAATKYRSASYTTKMFYNFLTTSSNATNNYLSKPWGFSEYGYWNQKGTSTEVEAPKYWQEVKAALLAGDYPKIKLYSVFDTNAAVGSTIYSSSSLVGLEFNANNLAIPNINEQTAHNDFVTTVLNTGSTTTPPPTSSAADINKDGKVDISDLSLLISKWGTADAASDVNDDGIVNIFDLSMVISKWGTTP